MPKKAIVTGATSGIGRALAFKLAEEGYVVGATGRRAERLAELTSRYPEQIIGVPFDIAEVDQITDKLKQIVDMIGGLDLMVANAGIGRRNLELALQPELETIAVNITAFVATVNFAANYFRAHGSGHIVGVSSVAAYWGNKRVPAYNASKAFEMNYLKALHSNLHSLGIAVTDIRPGFIRTEMTAGNPRMFWDSTPEKAAEQIYAAIEKKKRVAYITRRWRYVSWLMRITPQSLHRYIS